MNVISQLDATSLMGTNITDTCHSKFMTSFITTEVNSLPMFLKSSLKNLVRQFM